MTADAPPCPSCETAILVSGFAGREDWLCYSCSRTFDAPATFEARRDRQDGSEPAKNYW
jgi:tRNA(Ile2) C34 agmatinyltransferase TiaS